MPVVQLWNLVKIGAPNHMKDFFKNGKLYMNTIKYFKENESSTQRKDVSEGTDFLTQIDRMWLLPQGVTDITNKVEIKLTSAQFRGFGKTPPGNVFCMYGITQEWIEAKNRIDLKNAEFGSSMVLIYNTVEFINRVFFALEKIGLKGEFVPVHYYDEREFNGGLSVFCKPNKFMHQHEFRFYVENPIQEPLELFIGSIEDIAIFFEIIHLEEFRIEVSDGLSSNYNFTDE